MSTKYAAKKLHGGWVVVMGPSGHIVAKWFDTEEAAARVRDQFEGGRRTVDKKKDVWLVAESFVCEPYLGGAMIGEVDALDMRQYHVVDRMSQAEFDNLMNEAKDEDGCYPDT